MLPDPETVDSYLVPAVLEPWSRELIRRAQVWKGDKALDVACGTGIVACRIAGSGATVTGVDASPAMLQRAGMRASEEGVGVRWMGGTPDLLPFRSPEFDLVVCQQGLQHVGDRAAAAKELRRVIRPGGRAVVACWAGMERQPALSLLDPIAVQHLGAGLGAPYSLGDEATLSRLLQVAKFFAVIVETVTRQVRIPDPERFVRLTLASVVDEPASEPLERAVADGMAALASFIDGEHLVIPMVSVIGVGRVKTD